MHQKHRLLSQQYLSFSAVESGGKPDPCWLQLKRFLVAIELHRIHFGVYNDSNCDTEHQRLDSKETEKVDFEASSDILPPAVEVLRLSLFHLHYIFHGFCRNVGIA